MKLGTHKGKQIKVFTSIVFNWLFPDTIKSDRASIKRLPYILKDNYFDSVMISHMKNPLNKKIIKEMLNESYIDVDYAAAFPIFFEGLNPSSTDESLRQKTLKRLKELIDEAYYYRVKIFLICSGSDPGKENREKAKEKLVDSIGELCKYCYERKDDYALKVTLEPSDRELAKRFLMGPSIEVKEFCRQVKENHENFGVTVDLAHIYLSKEEPKDYLYNLKEYIEEVHINNCVMKDRSHPLFGDKHVPFGTEGGEIGEEEVTYFLKNLRDIGYFYRERPVVTFEVTPLEGQDIDTIIASFKRVFNKSWLKIQDD